MSSAEEGEGRTRAITRCITNNVIGGRREIWLNENIIKYLFHLYAVGGGVGTGNWEVENGKAVHLHHTHYY
jgi:hypothetical protein